MSLFTLTDWIASNPTISSILSPLKPFYKIFRWFAMIPIRIASSGPVQKAFEDTMTFYNLYMKNWFWVLMVVSTIANHAGMIRYPQTMKFQRMQIEYSIANSQSESDRWAEKWRMV